MITSAPQQPGAVPPDAATPGEATPGEATPGESTAAPAPPRRTPPSVGYPVVVPKRWPTLPVATWPLGVLVVAAGVFFDQAVRVGPGIGATMWATALVAVVLCAIVQHRPAPAVVPAPALAALVAAVGFAGSLSVRSTPWLVPLDLLAVLVLCVAAVVAARGEDPW